MKYHIARRHSNATGRVVDKWKICHQDFHGFYKMRKHKRNEHGAQRSSGAQIVDVAHVMGDVDDDSLKEELETCKHFLVDSEMENGRHRVYNIAIESLDPKYLLEKLDVVFDSLICAAKLKVAFCFVLKNVEDRSCRYSYAHENVTLLERSKPKATTKNLTKVQNLLSNADIIDLCTRKRANIQAIFYKQTNVKIFAALLKEVPMGFKVTALPDPLLKNHSIKCLTFEKNTRKPYNDKLSLFIALVLHLHGKERLEEETSKSFNLFLENLVRLILQTFDVFVGKILQKWKTLFKQIFPCRRLTLLTDLWLGSLRGGVSGKHVNAVRLLRYKSHICYVSNINAVFKAYRYPSCDDFIKRA